VTETGTNLRQLREQAGVSMQEIARRLGVHEPALSLIERGFRDMPEGFQQRYHNALIDITRERHEAALAATAPEA